jgi:hypothetical protein
MDSKKNLAGETGETGAAGTGHGLIKCYVACNPDVVEEANEYSYYGYILVADRLNAADIKRKAIALLWYDGNYKHLRHRKCIVDHVPEEDLFYVFITDTPRGHTGSKV